MPKQLYVISCNSAVESVFDNFVRAEKAAREILEEFTADNTNKVVEIDSFYSKIYFKMDSDTVVRIDITGLVEDDTPDQRVGIEGFEYMEAGRNNYPAYWSLDTNLCQFLAHNLELLASGVGAPHGWNEEAWEVFLRYHAKHLRIYAENKFESFDVPTRIAEIENAQRALRNVAAMLPHLWD